MANPYGRPKGSQNKNRLDVQARLDALGCDPVTGLATIAMDPANTPKLQAYCYSELLSYVAAKKKAVELSGDEESPVQVVFKWSDDEEEPTGDNDSN